MHELCVIASKVLVILVVCFIRFFLNHKNNNNNNNNTKTNRMILNAWWRFEMTLSWHLSEEWSISVGRSSIAWMPSALITISFDKTFWNVTPPAHRKVIWTLTSQGIWICFFWLLIKHSTYSCSLATVALVKDQMNKFSQLKTNMYLMWSNTWCAPPNWEPYKKIYVHQKIHIHSVWSQ